MEEEKNKFEINEEISSNEVFEGNNESELENQDEVKE